ncbi:hypothetical protein HMPREF2854_03025 [Actinomyces sp. HMSC075B09]|nr:hypothetical protein HMPREF2854_03025 [Actinomyces sp. HMSC075B09]
MAEAILVPPMSMAIKRRGLVVAEEVGATAGSFACTKCFSQILTNKTSDERGVGLENGIALAGER